MKGLRAPASAMSRGSAASHPRPQTPDLQPNGGEQPIPHQNIPLGEGLRTGPQCVHHTALAPPTVLERTCGMQSPSPITGMHTLITGAGRTEFVLYDTTMLERIRRVPEPMYAE